jgi:hypothetical protein
LDVESGNNQAGQISQLALEPLVIRVYNQNWEPLANAPIDLAVTGSDGTISLSAAGDPALLTSLHCLADSQGYVRITPVFSPNPGSCSTVSVVATTGSNQTSELVWYTTMDTAGTPSGELGYTSNEAGSTEFVTVTCATDGAILHYRLDGLVPDESDPTVVSGGTVEVASGDALVVRAFKAGMNPSEPFTINAQ